jgi:hypothetical protein
LAKQSSEVGELRRIVDDFVKTQIATSSPQQQDEEEIDFFSDPTKLLRAIAKHPSVKEGRRQH